MNHIIKTIKTMHMIKTIHKIQFYIKKNKTNLFHLLAILVGLWLVLYLIPEMVVSLFNTLLGNFILLIATLLVFIQNRAYGYLCAIVIIILYRFSHLSRENMTTLSQESQNDFLNIQSTLHKQTHFNMDMLANQVSQEDLNYFNENSMWYWSPSTIEMYENAVKQNKFVRSVPSQSTNYARTLYNENAILQLLSHQTKEGQFLLHGVVVQSSPDNDGIGSFADSSGLLENATQPVFRCNYKNNQMEQVNNEQTSIPMDYHDLETYIPGFTFLDQPCNPCVSLQQVPDYSCKFNLKVEGQEPTVSPIWKYLWNMN